MQIHIRHYAAGAEAASGLAVVIDVFRAFTVACFAFSRGAKAIIAVRDVETAWQLRKKHPESLLVGERHAKKLEGFDYGNSPSELKDADLAGRLVVHTTHAGTQALAAATGASDVITGSFVNASAVVRYIQRKAPADVSLVCSGFEGSRPALEDILCAEYLRGRLQERAPSFAAIKARLRKSEAARRFFDPEAAASPEADFWLCLNLDQFGFALRRARYGETWCELEAVEL
jgi:2-phosphosulfolactate phosphatase